MRNPIHKRLANLTSWQHYTFMACLCERMQGNFKFYCDLTDNSSLSKTYSNILNLVWEHLTVKNAKINLDNQLTKLVDIIPIIDNDSPFAISPAIDACHALVELIHSLIAGDSLNFAIKVSQISFKTIIDLLEAESQTNLTDENLKNNPLIVEELDLQWQIYRCLNSTEKFNLNLILSLKNEIKSIAITNIGIEMPNNSNLFKFV